MKSWTGWPPTRASLARWSPALVVASSSPWLDLIVKVARDRQDRSPSQASAQGFVPASAVGKRAEAREDVGQ